MPKYYQVCLNAIDMLQENQNIKNGYASVWEKFKKKIDFYILFIFTFFIS